MTIKEAQFVADAINPSSDWSDREWALRVLVGAYRREKLITTKLRDGLRDAIKERDSLEGALEIAMRTICITPSSKGLTSGSPLV